MAALQLTLTGDRSDLDFLRDNAQGVLEDLIEEYKRNLDGPVTVDWDFDLDE